MAEDQDSRTEDPTGKRLSQARDQGQVGMSRDVSTVISLTAATFVFLVVLPWSMQPLFRFMRGLIEHPGEIRVRNLADVQLLGWRIEQCVGWALAMPVAVLATAGIATTIAQTQGLLWAADKIKPDVKYLNPFNGFSRIFGWKPLFEFLRGVVKVALVGGTAFFIIKPEVVRVTLMIGMPPDQMLGVLIADIRRLLIGVILILGALTFFPALSLGPILEHLLLKSGQLF